MEEPRGTALRVVDGARRRPAPIWQPDLKWIDMAGEGAPDDWRFQEDGSSTKSPIVIKLPKRGGWICLLSDLHAGHRAASCSAATRTRTEVLRRKAHTIGMHNYIEMAGIVVTPSGSIWEQEFKPKTQVRACLNYFKPLVKAKLLDGLLDGLCHEGRMFKAFGESPVHQIADRLGARHLGTEGLIRYQAGDQYYDIAVWHGSGGAQTAGGQITALERMQTRIQADVYAMAHVHQFLIKEVRIRCHLDGQDILKPITFIQVPSHKDRDAWEEGKGFRPGVLGCVFVWLDGKQRYIYAEKGGKPEGVGVP